MTDISLVGGKFSKLVCVLFTDFDVRCGHKTNKLMLLHGNMQTT